MIVFKNLGKKEINSSGTIIFDSRTIKRLKANGEFLKKEEVYQAIFYPDDMLINNFYDKHVKKNSSDVEFTILLTEEGKEPTLKECEELIRISLLGKWKTKSSFFFKTYYEIALPKVNNKPFFTCTYSSIEKPLSLQEGLLRIDREPRKIKLKELPKKEKEEYENLKKKHYLHPEILFVEHITVATGIP
ncbi:MAG: hypothetical protein AABW58_02540 [Nanoarchaeota archaeon]